MSFIIQNLLTKEQGTSKALNPLSGCVKLYRYNNKIGTRTSCELSIKVYSQKMVHMELSNIR